MRTTTMGQRTWMVKASSSSSQVLNRGFLLKALAPNFNIFKIWHKDIQLIIGQKGLTNFLRNSGQPLRGRRVRGLGSQFFLRRQSEAGRVGRSAAKWSEGAWPSAPVDGRCCVPCPFCLESPEDDVPRGFRSSICCVSWWFWMILVWKNRGNWGWVAMPTLFQNLPGP